MSSKAKRPTLGDRLVRVKDILAIHRALLTRIEASERRIIALESNKESRETPATTGTPCS